MMAIVSSNQYLYSTSVSPIKYYSRVLNTTEVPIEYCHNIDCISHPISLVYVYPFVLNNLSISNTSQSTIDMEEDNDKQQEVSIPEGSYGNLICNGHYLLTMEGTLNYFYSSPQGRHSHFEPPQKLQW